MNPDRHGSDNELEVLVIDDDPAIREIIIGNLIEKYPRFHYRQAESGHTALAIIASELPDLILLDLRMPGLNGFALLRILRTHDRTHHIPVIVVSGLNDGPSVMKAMSLGANDYCVKPINFEMLTGKIESINSRLLHKRDYCKRHRSFPRLKVSCEAMACLQIDCPEKEGFWVNSPCNIEAGEPLLFDSALFFEALRLRTDDPACWARVEFCQKEEDTYHLKLLLDPLPENYGEKIELLGRSRDRFRRYFESRQSILTANFPCSILNVSGGGALICGSLPWEVGALVDLDVSDLIRHLGISSTKTRTLAQVRWTQQEGQLYQSGVRFDNIDEDLRLQIMTCCINGGSLSVGKVRTSSV